MPLILKNNRKPTPPVEAREARVLPGITALVMIPHQKKRAIGGLARSKNGQELTVRMNDLDRLAFIEGAKLCGLSMADYVRQCAVNMTAALKGQANASSSDGSSS